MFHHSKVAIVGGGPAGLTLANALHRHGWSVTVFEADSSSSARDQGGTLDLHTDGGQVALRKIGLLNRFLELARHEDQGERDIDHATGAVLSDEIPEPGTGKRPEIDRVVLRELLLERLGDDVVRWSCPVESVEKLERGGFALHLRDGTVGPFDLVVGADGAWSKVRPALTTTRPSYTGVTFVELWLHDVDRSHPDASKLVGRGTMFSLHDGMGIVAQRNGNAKIRVYAAFRTRPEETDRPDKTLAGITTADLLARYAGWAPALLSLISEADQVAAVRPIVALPADIEWASQGGITLVGDAAHVMPPLGTGVNLAMLDATDLGEALLAHGDLGQAVRLYEAVMLDRARDAARQAEQGFAMMFGPGSSQLVADHRAAVKSQGTMA